MHADTAQRINNRVKPLLDAAASQFAAKGYRETTIRDIATAVGMLPGSVYYHFASKQALLLAVYEEGVHRISSRLDESITGEMDPWQSLRKATEAHLETILDQSDYARVMIRVMPEQVPDIELDLIHLRSGYEDRFVALIDALPLQDDVDRGLLRLMLLGASNWTQIWYRAGSAPVHDIAQAFVDFLRLPLTTKTGDEDTSHEL